jgi:hypothetical protein
MYVRFLCTLMHRLPYISSLPLDCQTKVYIVPNDEVRKLMCRLSINGYVHATRLPLVNKLKRLTTCACTFEAIPITTEGQQGEGTRGVQEVERGWRRRETVEKEAKNQRKTGEVRMTAGRGGPSVAPPRNLQQLPTKLNLPGLLSGFQKTIPAVR